VAGAQRSGKGGGTTGILRAGADGAFLATTAGDWSDCLIRRQQQHTSTDWSAQFVAG
jgi:hypothetical protein